MTLEELYKQKNYLVLYAEAETPILWPPDVKSWLIWKDPEAGRDWGQEEKGTTEDEMASPTQWTWVWVNSGSLWWTGRPGVLQFIGSQRVRHDWATELNLCTQLCPTVCDPTDCSPPGSSVYRIFQARILERVAISFSRGSSQQPGDRTCGSRSAGRFIGAM